MFGGSAGGLSEVSMVSTGLCSNLILGVLGDVLFTPTPVLFSELSIQISAFLRPPLLEEEIRHSFQRWQHGMCSRAEVVRRFDEVGDHHHPRARRVCALDAVG